MFKDKVKISISIIAFLTVFFDSNPIYSQTDKSKNLQCTSSPNLANEPKTYLVGASKLSEKERKRIEKKWGKLTIPKGETERAKEVRRRAIGYQEEITRKLRSSLDTWINANPNATAKDIEEERLNREDRIDSKINLINAEYNKVRIKMKSWDWRDYNINVGPVMNQGLGCNTCWAFAASSAVASSLQKNYLQGVIPGGGYIFPDSVTGELSDNGGVPEIRKMSGSPLPFTQDLLNCMPIKKKQICQSGWHGNAFDFMVYRKGIPMANVKDVSNGADATELGEYLPGQKYTCLKNGNFIKASTWDYVNSPPDKLPTVQQLKEALIEHGPLVAPIFYDSCLANYRGGVFNEQNLRSINHVVLLIGWDDEKEAWLVKNSWGEEWGEKGFGWIKYGSNNIGMFAAWIDADFES